MLKPSQGLLLNSQFSILNSQFSIFYMEGIAIEAKVRTFINAQT